MHLLGSPGVCCFDRIRIVKLEQATNLRCASQACLRVLVYLRLAVELLELDLGWFWMWVPCCTSTSRHRSFGIGIVLFYFCKRIAKTVNFANEGESIFSCYIVKHAVAPRLRGESHLFELNSHQLTWLGAKRPTHQEESRRGPKAWH